MQVTVYVIPSYRAYENFTHVYGYQIKIKCFLNKENIYVFEICEELSLTRLTVLLVLLLVWLNYTCNNNNISTVFYFQPILFVPSFQFSRGKQYSIAISWNT